MRARLLYASFTLAVALLAGCAVQPPAPEVRSGGEAVPAPRAPEAARPTPPPAAPDSRQSTRLAARQHAAQGKRPLTVHTSCRFADETGYSGRLDLAVDHDDVRQLAADVSIPRHGNCHFALPEFRQAGLRPGVLLNSLGGACTVRMWEQGARVSVAFSNCAAHCSGGSHEYLWPILVDTRTGECS